MPNLHDAFVNTLREEMGRRGMDVSAAAEKHLRDRIRASPYNYMAAPPSLSAGRQAARTLAAILEDHAELEGESAVTIGFLEGVLGKLCPGFFPIC